MPEKFGGPEEPKNPQKGAAETGKDSHYYRAAEDAREDARQGVHRTDAEVEAEAKRYRRIERVKSLGSQLHEEWRKPRWREESKDYEPRIKKTKDEAWSQAHGGAVEVDIANTPYEGLPSEWQGENKISAEIAVTEVEKAIEAGMPLDESFVETASSTLHDKWLERNGSWAPPEQNKPYTELSEEEREKDRVIIRKAVEVCGRKE